MITISNNAQIQGNLVLPQLSSMLDSKNELYQLSNQIDWNSMQDQISVNYSEKGRPSIPIRCLIGLQIVKFFKGLSDRAVLKEFEENPYVQYFCGFSEFQKSAPCTDATMSIFRKKIGASGAEVIFQESVNIHELDIKSMNTIADTTVACKNITYPTDVKLLSKAAEYLHKIAKKHNIKLNNTYKHQINKLKKTLRFENTLRKTKEWRKSKSKLRTLIGRIYREIKRKMNIEQCKETQKQMDLIQKVLNQTISDSYYCQQHQTINNIKQAIKHYCLLKRYLKELNISIPTKTENMFQSVIQTLKLKKPTLKEAKSLFESIIKLINNTLKSIPNDLDVNFKQRITVISDYVSDVKKDKKVYSLHEPQVRCITKGKPGKKHEYGAKASIVIDSETCIVIGTKIFHNNPYDGDTLEPTLQGIEEQFNCRPDQVTVDRGYKGCQANGVKVIIPHSPKKGVTDEDKTELSKTCSRRSAIEPIIGHIKYDHRLHPVRLKGTLGDTINLSFSAAAFNLRKWCNKNLNKC